MDFFIDLHRTYSCSETLFILLLLSISVDKAGIEDQRLDQSSGPEAEVQSTAGHVDQEQQQQQQRRQELEDGLSDLDQEGNTSQNHRELQVGRISHMYFYIYK